MLVNERATRRFCLNTPLSGLGPRRNRLSCRTPADDPGRSTEQFVHPRDEGWRRPSRLATKIAESMSGLPGREPFIPSQNLVLDPNSQQWLLTDGSEDGESIVEKCRPQ